MSVPSSIQRKPEGIARTNLPREPKEERPPYAAAPSQPPITLTPSQTLVVERAKRGSVVVTGPGGSGKSYAIRALHAWAEKAGVNMAVTSLTGAAALVLQIAGATTLHRWAGIGLGKLPLKETLDKMRFKTYLHTRWQSTQILVIDEVSMMSQKLFDLLDGVARAMRRTPNLPFGGLRVVVFGDFYQLAPVPDQQRSAQLMDMDPSGKFCFESPLWFTMFPPSAHLQLTQMVRQNGDPEFQAVLAEIRVGDCSDASAEYLSNCVVAAGKGNSAVIAAMDAAAAAASSSAANAVDAAQPPPIKLYPKNVMVDHENDMAYARVDGAEHVYDQLCATDLDRWLLDGTSFGTRDLVAIRKSTADSRRTELQFMQSGLPCSEKLRLKVGTAVILITNLDVDNGLANGSQGTVVRFEHALEAAAAGKGGDDMEGVLAAAAAIVCAGGGAGGQQRRILVPKPQRKTDGQLLPVVRFANGLERAISMHWWQSASVPCVGVGQIPLKHGWARSIHASQGATYDTAQLDIGGDVFAPGQTYVAVSRVRSGKGLRLVRFDRSKIRADPKVTAFYKHLVTSSASSDAAATAATGIKEEEEGDVIKPIKKSVVGGKRAAQQSPPNNNKVARTSIWGDDDDDDE